MRMAAHLLLRVCMSVLNYECKGIRWYHALSSPQSLTRAVCDFPTSELHSHCWRESIINGRDEHALAPHPDVHGIKYKHLFRRHRHVGEGGEGSGGGTLQSNILIISFSFTHFFHSLSVHYSLHCLCSPTPRLLCLTPPPLLLSFTLSYSSSLFCFGQEHGWDHNYVLTHGVSP